MTMPICLAFRPFSMMLLMNTIYSPKGIGQGEELGCWNGSLLYSGRLGTKGVCLDGPVSRARTTSYVLCRGGLIQVGVWSVAL